jgi:hypothetical protein
MNGNCRCRIHRSHRAGALIVSHAFIVYKVRHWSVCAPPSGTHGRHFVLDPVPSERYCR